MIYDSEGFAPRLPTLHVPNLRVRVRRSFAENEELNSSIAQVGAQLPATLPELQARGLPFVRVRMVRAPLDLHPFLC